MIGAALIIAVAILLAPQLANLVTHYVFARDLNRRQAEYERNCAEHMNKQREEFMKMVEEKGFEPQRTPYGFAVSMQSKPEPDPAADITDEDDETPRKPS